KFAVVANPVNDKFASPEFVTAIDCPALAFPAVTLPKFTDIGAAAIVLLMLNPVPVSATVCGAAELFSDKLSIPARAPLALGANVTFTEQIAPIIRTAGQLLVCVKSPLAEIPEIFMAELPT